MNPTLASHRWKLFGLMLIYGAVLFASVTLLRHRAGLPEIVKIAAALAPMIPVLFVLPLVILTFRQLDEMQARHRLESIAAASVVTGFLALTYGFLERIGFPKLSMFVVWAVLGTAWIVGDWIQRWRFR